ncbi:pilus assembly protein PilM [Phycisphaeraceae bacterium D3-23]
MAFGISKSRMSPIAIDFGTDTVKLLQISSGGGTTQLVAAGAMNVPESARSDAASRYAFVGEAVKSILSQQPFKGKRAICAIPAYQTMVSVVELPGSDAKDIDAQINLHIQTVLEKDPSRMVVRNHHLGQVMRDGSAKQRVLTLSAPRSTVMRYIELATAAKLEVVGMHSEPMCIAKPFIELYNRREIDQTGTRCFVDVGAAMSKIVIIHNGQVLMARTLRAAGEEMTLRHAKQHGLDFTEARLARIREANNPLAARPFPSKAEQQHEQDLRRALVGAPILSEDTAPDLAVADSATELEDDRRVEPAAQPAMALEDLDETLDSLVEGLRMTIRYHDSVCPDHPVDQVVMLGGEAGQRSVNEAVAFALGLPTFVGHPLARVMRTPGLQPLGLDMNKPQPGWAVPLGLCLSEANL